MAPPNLTRTDAAARAALLDVADYTVEIDLTDGPEGGAAGKPGDATFGTTTTVRFRCAEPGADSWVDLIAAEVASATLNGAPLDVAGYREDDGIALPELAAENELRVEATGRYMNTGEGLHRFVDPVDGSVYLYSQFETADAKRLFACFDQPDLKARYQLTVTAPADWKVVSNARGRGGHRRAGRRRRAPLRQHRGPLHLPGRADRRPVRGLARRARTHGIPLGIYCRASLAEHMDEERLFTETKQGFDFYHRNFGVRYPFGKYDQLFVPEFNAGAMENAGAVTFLEDYVFRSRVTRFVYERRAETVLHEMAHMWFGDLVTMRWWDDLWLNESFATFASVLCQAEATEYTAGLDHLRQRGEVLGLPPGPAALHAPGGRGHPGPAGRRGQLRRHHLRQGRVGAQAAGGLRRAGALPGRPAQLLRRARLGQRDLRRPARRAGGGLADGTCPDWGAQWLRTTGLNLLRPSFDVDDAGRFTRFDVVQGGARPGAGEMRTHRIAVGIYDDDGRASSCAPTGSRSTSPASAPRSRSCSEPRAGKLVLVNDDDLTYCALRLDPGSLATLIDRIGDIAEPLPRTLCWSAAWEMTREAELKARDFVALVAGGFGAESEVGVVQRLLLQAQTTVVSYADEQWAAERGWPLLVDSLLFRLDTAPAGSDAQLTVVNALTSSVLYTPVLESMRGWLDDVDVPPGLTVDTDLRWRLLHALVAHGAAGAAEIDAELQRDPTSTGQRQAERARALIPTAAAKERAWERAVTDDEIPNAVQEAIISGFSHPAQRGLLGSYVERYFAAVAEVWSRRTSERAQSVVVGLFPSWAVDKKTVDAADSWLADESHPPALRRLVSEGRAGIVRALGAREFDRS